MMTIDNTSQGTGVDQADERARIATLFDIENDPGRCAAGVLTKLSELGQVVSSQAFGDYRRTDSEGWSAVCDVLQIEARQVDRSIAISVAITADIHIVIDVIDTLHGKRCSGGTFRA